jgi:hypothetical protein
MFGELVRRGITEKIVTGRFGQSLSQILKYNTYIIRFLLFLQRSLIQTKKGIKVGFLGYSDVLQGPKNLQSCLSVRKTYNAGPAIYSAHIAKRDVLQLKVS